MEPRPAWLRLPCMRLAPYVLALVTTVAAGCGALTGDTGIAVWTVTPGQSLDAQSTEIDVLVPRVGCNSGVTGQVVEPDVHFEGDRVIVSFTVQPGQPTAANCQGNAEVPYTLTLPEPLGNRQLVDGQCLNDRETPRTSVCEPGALR